MILRLIFRTDPLTGNRILRTGLIVGLLFVIGATVWLASDLTTAKAGQSVEGLILDHSEIESAGRRQVPINPEIAELVADTPATPPGLGEESECLPQVGMHAMTHARESAPPRFLRAGSTQTAEGQPFLGDGEKKASKYTQDNAHQSGFPSISSEGGTFGGAPRSLSTGHTRHSTGSAVIFKRQEDQAIQKRDTSFASNEPGLAPGTVIGGQLRTGIVSGATLPVILRIRENVIHRGMVAIPAGSTLLGNAEANYESRRLFVAIDRLIIGDSEIDIRASVVDNHGRAGICDRYIDTARQQLLPAFFAGMLAEFGRAFSACNTVGVPVPMGCAENQAKSAFLSGTSSGLDAVAQALAARAKEARAVIIAYPDQMVHIVLADKIPLEPLLQAIRGR